MSQSASGGQQSSPAREAGLPVVQWKCRGSNPGPEDSYTRVYKRSSLFSFAEGSPANAVRLQLADGS